MITTYIENNSERFIDELITFLKIPSVSAVAQHKGDMQCAAKYVQKQLKQAGADTAEVYKTAGHPIVYGEKRVNHALSTVLVYGHYDVQPPDPLDLWESPPFDPVIKEGKVFARGASDDKGQVYMHIKVLESLVALNCLHCNIKFIIEGEEEVGSCHLAGFIKEHKEILQADIALVSDTTIISTLRPSITVGLRGLVAMEVEVTGPNRDLHSGMYGGAIANPIHMLCDMIHALKDERGHIAIPGFYDRVKAYSKAERAKLSRVAFDEVAYCSGLGVAATKGERGYNTPERVGIRPSLDINGVWGGYTGEGAKTVLPAKAHAKISMRLVPNQVGTEAAALLSDYLQSIMPEQGKLRTKLYGSGDPIVVSTTSAGYRAAHKAFEAVWNKAPVPTYDGGSIPIIALFKDVLGLDTMLMGFGLGSDAIHAPNEHYGIDRFLLGIETLAAFHKYFAKYAEADKRG